MVHPKSSQHISTRHISIARIFNISLNRLEYDINIEEQAIVDARLFVKKHNFAKIIVINPYGPKNTRDMAIEQINELCSLCQKTFNSPPFIIGLQSKTTNTPDSEDHIKFTLPDFQQAAAIVKLADVVISTDTSIVHLCRAMNKKLVCIYNNKTTPGGEDNNIVWGPDYDNAIQILSPTKKVAGTPAKEIFIQLSRLISL